MRDLLVLLCLLPAAMAAAISVDDEQPDSIFYSLPPDCTPPSDRGTGEGAFTHYYFNQETESCEPFTYSGEGGNRNNFRTRFECRAACKCTQGAERGRREKFCHRHHYYDIYAGKCRQYRYRGCNTKVNRFRSERSCNRACATARCYLNRDRGACDDRIQRYFYNVTSQQCEGFKFGGCRGNLNNFGSLEVCDQSCSEPIREIDIRTKRHRDCYLPKKEGVCSSSFERFYFNTETGECESFTYRGCNGNLNNFKTEMGCRDKCMPPQPRE
ncbi:carboxypeptidase inhibitor SmCI-like [Aplysia californica]|uniref:Carboxypeptidase inhibitor SmCI-like n=1 Tax=Aplysia californica TaxID=6500 RepID=A0ABM1A0Q7_APLCA|nr:carboxypeptidase inhibitor SmCI-like [Aplysia californica]